MSQLKIILIMKLKSCILLKPGEKKTSASGAADDLCHLSLSLSDMFFENMSRIVAVTVVFTFEGLSRLKQERPLGKLIIWTCVRCTVLCAIIHLGGDRSTERWEVGWDEGSRGSEKEPSKMKQKWTDMKRADKHKGRGRVQRTEKKREIEEDGKEMEKRHLGRWEQRVRENKNNSFIKLSPLVRYSLIIKTLKIVQQNFPCILSFLSVLSPSGWFINPLHPILRLTNLPALLRITVR